MYENRRRHGDDLRRRERTARQTRQTSTTARRHGDDGSDFTETTEALLSIDTIPLPLVVTSSYAILPTSSTHEPMNRGATHTEMSAQRVAGRPQPPNFYAKEKEKEDECHLWGVDYEPPRENESDTQTKNRRLRLTRAIKQRKNPAAHEATLAARRFERESERCSDPAGHEASLVADSARKRSRYQSKSPSKRPRDDSDGKLPASPDGGEAMDIDGESTTSPGRGEPMDIDGVSTASPDRGKAAGDRAKAKNVLAP